MSTRNCILVFSPLTTVYSEIYAGMSSTDDCSDGIKIIYTGVQIIAACWNKHSLRHVCKNVVVEQNQSVSCLAEDFTQRPWESFRLQPQTHPLKQTE